MRSFRFWWLFSALIITPTVSLFGQGAMGIITGLVTDPSGAVVSNASITATEINTGVLSKMLTSSAGYYRLPVPPGVYRIEVSATGFETEVIEHMEVGVAQILTRNFRLRIGSTQQQITVTSTAPLLETSTGELSASMPPTEFETLPIEIGDGGRDPQTFIYLSLAGTIGGPGYGSINGGQPYSTQVLIDGVTVGRYDYNDGLTEFSPSTDAIGEFNVLTSNYSAEYGQTGSGIASFSMKSGTNQFHGTAYEYLKNPVFNAAGVVADTFNKPKNNTKDNDFGATLGGPIKRDRTFFFIAWESDRFRNFSFSGTTTVPTPAMLHGNFSSWLGPQVGTDALGRPVYQNEIYNPLTTRSVPAGSIDPITGLKNVSGATAIIRDPFSYNGQLNVIPPEDFSKATSVLLGLFPSVVNGANINNALAFSGCCPELNRDAGSVKVDQVISDTQKLSMFFNYNARSRYIRGSTTSPPFPDQPVSTYKQQLTGGPMVRLSHTWTINNHSVNEATVAYNRFYDTNGYVANGAEYAAKMDISGTSQNCFPMMTLSSSHLKTMSNIGIGCASSDPTESYFYQDIFSTIHGRHSLKFGASYIRYHYNTYEPSNTGGTFNFSDVQTALPGFETETGHPFASFLLGAANSGSTQIFATEPGYRQGAMSFFAQDDFKISSRLTLNLGLRWELPTPKTEAFDRMSGFDATVPNAAADGIPGALVFLGNCPTCLHKGSFETWYFKNLAPRFGLAYQISSNIVFRGGYGISYDPPIEWGFGEQNTFGFNSSVNVPAGTSPTGFYQDPALYLSPLANAPLPAVAQVGIPRFTGTLPDYDPTQANGNIIDFLPKDALRLPYVQNWSAGFQFQLPARVLLETNYVGSKGTRLVNNGGAFSGEYDQVPGKYMGLGDILAMDFATALATPSTAAVLAQYGITKLPYPNFETENYSTTVAAGLAPFPQFAGIVSNQTGFGNSTYHSAQITARRESSSGFTFIASYTFSKILTDSDASMYSPGTAQDFYNRRLEKSIASFDQTHALKLTWIYALPFGHGKRWMSRSGKLDPLVSGWQLTAIQTYTSGDPLEITAGISPGFPTGGERGDIILGQPLTVPSSGLDVIDGTPYLNPAAFANPPASPENGFALRPGTAPRYLPNVFGPAHFNEDFGIIKETRVTERTTVQLRADMFNVLNRTGRGDPDTNLGDGLPSQGGTFGLITSPWNTPRVIQFSLRCNF